MLLGIEVDAIPVFEDFDKTLEVFLLKAVEMDYFGGALENLDLEAFRGAAPLGTGNVAAVESPGVATARGLPAETIFSEATFTGLLGEVEEDIVEGFTGRRTNSQLGRM